jgi:ssDNA-binding Zn-finger/Zn-ribbon topoisomerase 1
LSFYCPVCNGLESLELPCPNCHEQTEDYGKFTDLLLDYSPYRPIDDLKQTDGFLDLASHDCVHVVYCPNCGYTSNQAIQEWKGAGS